MNNTNNKRNWSLIVHGHDFSLSNNTDSDPMTDYSPGIWGISSQAKIIKYAQEILADGDSITVTDYNMPQYHSVANKMITELGLKQDLFKLPDALVSTDTKGKPSTLGALKKYLTVGKKVNIKAYRDDSTILSDRDTFVTTVQTNSITVDKSGGKSWVYYGKATGWSFDSTSANYYYVDGSGNNVLSIKITYID